MMAKMRTSRSSLSKAALQLGNRGVQPLDVGGEASELATAHERAAFGGGVIGERLRQALRGVGLPARKRPQRAADALGSDIAHDTGELLLEIPAEVFLQEAQLIRQCALAGHAFQRDDCAGLAAAGLDPAAGTDDQSERRQERRAKFRRLPDMARQALAGPALPGGKRGEEEAKGPRGGG